MPAPATGATQRLVPNNHIPPDALAPGALVGGRFRVDALLGFGGQALVYRAADTRRGGMVALKQLRSDLRGDDLAAAAAALVWEGRLLQRLHHPALPSAVQLQSGPAPWLARELVLGHTLAESPQPAEPRAVLAWALALCDLLTYLHTRRQPVICGDLKPRNLVLRSDGGLALIDLGAAQTLTRRPPRAARPRHGTPGYAAPEQLGAWGGDERSDLFALAVTCYELLTGLDPAVAPLQFDLGLLDRRAAALARPLRWALELDRTRRPPTAAVLRAALEPVARSQPLVLAPQLRVDDVPGLIRAVSTSAPLLEGAVTSGALDVWLASHPRPEMGALVHELRAARKIARGGPLAPLLHVLTPPQGAPSIQFWPRELHLGRLPLRRWRTWLRGRRLTLRNSAEVPLRWELEGESRPDADVRVWVGGRAQRKAGGVLLPGASAELEIVAAGRPGSRQGRLVLRCGSYLAEIPWRGEPAPGLPLGDRLVPTLADLDPDQPGLVPLLEDLLCRGLLRRWLEDQGRADLAALLPTAPTSLGPQTARLLLGSVLHQRDPRRFPRLAIVPQTWQGQPIPVGGSGQGAILVSNLGTAPCTLHWSSRCPWAGTSGAPVTLLPGQRFVQQVLLLPPAELTPGDYQVDLEVRSGALMLPVALTLPVVQASWWHRVMGWLGR